VKLVTHLQIVLRLKMMYLLIYVICFYRNVSLLFLMGKPLHTVMFVVLSFILFLEGGFSLF
jgi:hypothetical protein